VTSARAVAKRLDERCSFDMSLSFKVKAQTRRRPLANEGVFLKNL
jgi:hypothetical protein